MTQTDSVPKLLRCKRYHLMRFTITIYMIIPIVPIRKQKNLSKSRAVVKVFGEGKLLHNIRVPQDGKGNVWKVLEIRKGKVVLIGNITDKYR